MNEKAQDTPLQLTITEKRKGKEIESGAGRAAWLYRVGDYYIVAWQQASSTTAGQEQYYRPTIKIISAEGTDVSQLRAQRTEISLSAYLAEHFPNKRYFACDSYATDRDVVTPSAITSDYWRELFFKKNPGWRTGKENTYTNANSVGSISLDYQLPSSVVCGGKYLSSRKGETQYIIQVRNDAGVPLPKDRWVIYDPKTDPETLPDDIKKWLKEAEEGAQYFSVGTGLEGKVGKNGLEIYKTGDYQNPIFKDASITDVDSHFATLESVPPTLVTIGKDQPNYIKLLQLDGDTSKWVMRSVTLPPELRFPVVKRMILDPSGAFMMLDVEKKIIIITLDSLEKVGEITGASSPSFDSSGRFSVIKNNVVAFLDANFNELSQTREAERQKRIASGIRPAELFLTDEEQRTKEVKAKAEQLKPIIDQILPEFTRKAEEVRTTRSREGVRQLELALENLRSQLAVRMPGRQMDVSAIVELVQRQCVDPVRKEIYQKTVGELITRLKTDLQTSLSMQAIGDLTQDYEEVKKMIPWLEESQKTEVFEIGRDLQRKTSEFLSAHSHEFIEQAKRYVEIARQKLETFSSKTEIESWVEFEYPSLLNQLGALQRQCPQEAVDAIQAITKARIELGDLVVQFETKFKREYAQIREQASEQNTAIGQSLSIEIKRFIERILDNNFPGELRQRTTWPPVQHIGKLIWISKHSWQKTL